MKLRGTLALQLCLPLFAVSLSAPPSSAQTLTAQPPAVTFSYSTGEQQLEPVVVTITGSDGTTPSISATLTNGSATPAGLFVLSVAANTVSVDVSSSILNTLLNQGGLFLADITVTATGFPALTVPVTLSVNAGLSLQALPPSLTFSAGGPGSQTIALTGTGGASLSFTYTSTTTSGGNWLSVSSSSTLTPATLTVTANSGLLTGTYNGTITVTPMGGSALTIPVTLDAGTANLSASPATLAFAYVIGSTLPPVQVLNLSASIPNDTFTAQPASSGNWLLVNGSSGKVAGTLPDALNVGIDITGLLAGTYQGSIALTSGDGSTLTVPVSLAVTGVSTVANPTTLTFVAQAGEPAPATQTVLVNGGANATFTAVASSSGGWLSVSQSSGSAPAQLTVIATPGTLVAGTYPGSIHIAVGPQFQIVQATLVVSATAVLETNPGELIEFYVGGNSPPAPFALSVNVSSGSTQAFTISAGLPPWLEITGAGGTLTAPTNLLVTVNPIGLANGTYFGDIVLVPVAQGGNPVIVPVLVLVSNAPPIVSNPASLTFNPVVGGAPQSQTLQISAPVQTIFQAAATTAGGGTWLTISPVTGTAGPVNTALTVTADPTNLAAGTYTGIISLTTSESVVTPVPVTLIVGPVLGTFAISPSTLSFSYAQGGTEPAAQSIQVTGNQNFTAAASVASGTNWLSVTPATGTGNFTLNVTVNPAGLAPGTYNGTVTVTPAGGAAQTVAVSLTVTATSTLSAVPNSLVFLYRNGDPNPVPQTVALTASAADITFTATASAGGWLSVIPTSGTTPNTLTVSVDVSDLGPGSYTGSIALTTSSGPVTIPVSLSVSAPLPFITSVVNAASYAAGGVSPGEIVVLFGTALGPTKGVGATVDSSGFIETSLANVTVTFNGFPAPVLYAGGTQVNAIVPYELAGVSNALVVLSFGQAKSNSVNLAVVSSAPGVFSANGSGTGGGALLDTHYHLVSSTNPAPVGSTIQIYATGEGQTNPAGVDGKVAGLVLPLPAPKLPASVLIGNLPAHIQYVGAAPGLVAGALQVNAVIPDGLTPGNYSVVVSIGGNPSQMGLTVAVQ